MIDYNGTDNENLSYNSALISRILTIISLLATSTKSLQSSLKGLVRLISWRTSSLRLFRLIVSLILDKVLWLCMRVLSSIRKCLAAQIGSCWIIVLTNADVVTKTTFFISKTSIWVTRASNPSVYELLDDLMVKTFLKQMFILCCLFQTIAYAPLARLVDGLLTTPYIVTTMQPSTVWNWFSASSVTWRSLTLSTMIVRISQRWEDKFMRILSRDCSICWLCVSCARKLTSSRIDFSREAMLARNVSMPVGPARLMTTVCVPDVTGSKCWYTSLD